MRHFPKYASRRRGLLLIMILVSLTAAQAVAGPVPPAPDPTGSNLSRQAPPAPERLGEAQRARLASLVDEAAPVPRERQTVRWLGILVEFSDETFPDSLPEAFDPLDILGYPDSTVWTPRDEWYLNVMSQVNDYYQTVSGGSVILDFNLADSLVSLPSPMIDYGDDEIGWVEGVHMLATDAVAAIDSFVDFSAYDLVTFIHAGAGQESDLLRDSPEQIWSGYVDWASLTETFADSVPPDSLLGIFPGILTGDQDSTFVLQRFSIAPEEELEDGTNPPFVLGTLGVYAHQLGGFLGLVSLNDYVDPRAQGVGNFDLMGSGLWNALGFVPGPPSAFNRMLMGWNLPVIVDKSEAQGTEADDGAPLTIHSFEQGADTLLLKFPISDREYFLVENRNQDAAGDTIFTFDDANGNHIPDNGESLLGAEFDYYTTQSSSTDLMPGSGLFFWRIDEELIHLTFLYDVNLINAYNDHYGVFLLEADGYSDLSNPSLSSEAYGSDYDAFRAEGGVNGLPATQTRLGPDTLPSTRSVEGADTGWEFHSVGAHGPVMDFVALWREDRVIGSVLLEDLYPAGDPLIARLHDLDGAPPAFVFAASDGADSTFVFAYLGLQNAADREEPASRVPLIAVEGLPAGSPAAGDLDDDDGIAEVVLLMTDGRLFAWRGDGSSLGGGDADTPLVTLSGGGATPLLHDLDALAGESTEPGLEILAVEHIAGSESVSDSVRLRWFDSDGSEIHPAGADAESWAGAWPGRPAGDLALGLEVAPGERGYDHPEPKTTMFNVCLVDTVGEDAGWIYRLVAPASQEWVPPLSERTLSFTPVADPVMNLVSADLDADGCDELIFEAQGQIWFWYPRGRFGGAQSGETLFASGAAASVVSLLPADLDGNGAMEIVVQETQRLQAFGNDAALIGDWSLSIPQTDPAPGYTDPATWTLALRDEAGRDSPLLFTRDGRLFAGREALGRNAAVLLGGNLAGSPVLGQLDADLDLELAGLAAFQPVEGNSSPEDTLRSGARLRYWLMESDWGLGDYDLAWSQGGADARRSRRVAALSALEISATGTGSFLEAYPYPNPAGRSVTWRVRSDSADRFEIELYDLEGQLRLVLEGESDGFSPWEAESELVGLAPGVYFFNIHSDQSGRIKQGRLAIIR